MCWDLLFQSQNDKEVFEDYLNKCLPPEIRCNWCFQLFASSVQTCQEFSFFHSFGTQQFHKGERNIIKTSIHKGHIAKFLSGWYLLVFLHLHSHELKNLHLLSIHRKV